MLYIHLFFFISEGQSVEIKLNVSNHIAGTRPMLKSSRDKYTDKSWVVLPIHLWDHEGQLFMLIRASWPWRRGLNMNRIQQWTSVHLTSFPIKGLLSFSCFCYNHQVPIDLNYSHTFHKHDEQSSEVNWIWTALDSSSEARMFCLLVVLNPMVSSVRTESTEMQVSQHTLLTGAWLL